MEPTKITITNWNVKISFELPYSDCTIDELLNGIVACLRGCTFSEEQIIQAFKDYVK